MGLDSTHREEVKRDPLTPPNVDRATEMGMIQAMTPKSFSPKVYERKQGMGRKERLYLCTGASLLGMLPPRSTLTKPLTKLLRGGKVFVPCPPSYTTTSHRDHYTAGNQ